MANKRAITKAFNRGNASVRNTQEVARASSPTLAQRAFTHNKSVGTGRASTAEIVGNVKAGVKRGGPQAAKEVKFINQTGGYAGKSERTRARDAQRLVTSKIPITPRKKKTKK